MIVTPIMLTLRTLPPITAAFLVTAACTAPSQLHAPISINAVRAVMPAETTTVVSGEGPAGLALATSRALYRRSPAVVLVREDDPASLQSATAEAVEMGVPLLLTPAADDPVAERKVKDEIDRLAVRVTVPIGKALEQEASFAPARFEPPQARITARPPLDRLLGLALDDAQSQAALATVRAAGARVLQLSNPDPRTADAAIEALSGQSTEHVLALGDAFSPADRLRHRIETAATGVRLPGGG